MDLFDLVKEKYQYIFEEELLREIGEIGIHKKVPADTTFIEIGEKVAFMPLVMGGAIKILSDDKEGGELLLYYLEVGDTCAMTLNCCLGNTSSVIRAVTELPTEIIQLPVGKMESWIIRYKSWRAFVFDSYNSRLNEMLEAVDILAFHNMEDRLYMYLENKVKVTGSPNLNITHWQVAADLNSSRVVISRLMKKLEKEGKIHQQRNQIDVVKYL